MKLNQKKSAKVTLSDKIADALTVKPRADIEDDQVFETKPQTLTKADFDSSGNEDEAVISEFRKRNVNLLSEISNKYDGQVVSRKKIEASRSDNFEDSDSDEDSNLLSAKELSLYDDHNLEDSDSDEDSNLLSAKELSLYDDQSNNSQDSDDENTQTQSKPAYDSDQDDIETQSKSEDDSDQENTQVQSKPIKVPKAASDSEDFSETEEESDDYSITQFKKQITKSDEDDNDEDGTEEEREGYDISEMNEPMQEDFEHVKKQNVSEEAKKGACVRNQLLIWEGLLEMRIHLQRCMTTANQMPLPDTHKEMIQNNVFAEECNATKANIATVLDKFLDLQNILLKRFPETKTISLKKWGKEVQETEQKDASDEEIPSDTDNEEIPSDTEDEDSQKDVKEVPKKTSQPTTSRKRKLQDYEKEISVSHKAFKSFRDSTIQKWNEKTRLATASAIKNKNAPTNTVLQQISYILSDRDKLVRRTQLKRSEYDIIGYKKPVTEEHLENVTELPRTKDRKDDDEYIPEIFDDSDFYHQLLRELIECKSADISDPVQLSRQWIALQQMRSKMKRKVDTKATKGRKIKYVVHNQLVNYMAPEKCTTWTDESTNELYSSLFGKMFESNNVGLNANLENGFKLKN